MWKKGLLLKKGRIISDKHKSPWVWIPSLYFAEGLPMIVISSVSVIMYKKMGISNTDIALFTSWLYLPWVIKGIWSPFVDICRTKRFWILLTQFIMGAGFACVALAMPLPAAFQVTFIFFWLLAFNSATHDIAADGFYILGLDEHQQVWFCGIRNTFYRLATITAQGLLVMFAGHIESSTGLEKVDVNISSVASVDTPRPLEVSSFTTCGPTAPEGGGIKIICEKTTLRIPMITRNKKDVDQLLNTAKGWNGTRIEEKPPEKEGRFKKWWKTKVTAPIGAWLTKKIGGKEKIISDETGNADIISIRLSAPPPEGKNIIVTFGREAGDKSLNLLEGDRRVFSKTDWNRPMISVIQLDKNLKKESSAKFTARAGNIQLSWVLSFIALAVVYLAVAVYHFFFLPRPTGDKEFIRDGTSRTILQNFFVSFKTFFTRKEIIPCLCFLLLYRFAEAQLVKLASPFLLDAQEKGGLALSTGDVGFVYGTVGIFALMTGGLAGAFLAAKYGLKKCIWPMAFAIHLPDLMFVYLAYVQPESLLKINLCVATEQFGYGVGFTGYMLYMVYFVENSEFKSSHYAIMTGFMALGMMVPGMFSGYIQEHLGYKLFFVWVIIATIPAFISLLFLKIDPEFGIKKQKPPQVAAQQ